MKLDGIVAFIAVAEGGSINEAARQLRLSKSAVSERLTELERGLGTHLLQRNSRQLALTEDGAAFLLRARRIAAEAHEAADELAHRRGEMSGPLRIAAPRGFGDGPWDQRSTPSWSGIPESQLQRNSTTVSVMPPVATTQ